MYPLLTCYLLVTSLCFSDTSYITCVNYLTIWLDISLQLWICHCGVYHHWLSPSRCWLYP